ncbi:hypothetical protein CERSUDRAFT_68572 [Gelatoporia subvermispora B]|uniref:Copper homeostasis protein cutC homolog n=1 Tax=Ceriporiopsis subvermispora (strain B) TaxID=914234 RepID=M2R2S8_CERS8|nr:hypothetical protein CERSUDRAFT_68572 [Gelatoporia subvermispora B]
MNAPDDGITIEVCVDSVESAAAAVQGGADRLELCSNLGLGGGTTPSLGLLRSVQRAVPRTPIMVMVRPRTGDFLYSEGEFNVMLEDIRIFKESGTAGVVFGVLDQSGAIDVDRTQKLANEAFPMQGIPPCGHGRAAPSSLHVLRTLFATASGAHAHSHVPALLPGAGINAPTARPLLDALLPCGLREIHLSAGAWEPGAMRYRPEGMGMGLGGDGEWGVWRASEERVRAVRAIADAAVREHTARVAVESSTPEGLAHRDE